MAQCSLFVVKVPSNTNQPERECVSVSLCLRAAETECVSVILCLSAAETECVCECESVSQSC